MLNPMAIDEDLYWLGIEFDKMEKQRDDLLEACKEVIKLFDNQEINLMKHYNILEKAILKARKADAS